MGKNTNYMFSVDVGKGCCERMRKENRVCTIAHRQMDVGDELSLVTNL